MADDVSEPVDLLGDPLRPLPDRRGRRKLRFTSDVYDKVEVLRASGMTQAEIAKNIGVTVPTLMKYFFQEVRDADVRVRGDIIAAVVKKALTGNTPAARLALQLLEQGAAAVPVAKASAAPNAEPLGKKAALDLAAQNGDEGTEWAEVLH